MWEFTCPRKIIFGEESLDYLKEIEGNKALIVTGKTVRRLGFPDRVSDYLKEAGISVEVFDEVEPEPSIETVLNGAEIARRFSPDWIIGLGGGSNMDAAKGIWALYENPEMDVHDISPMENLGLRKKAHFICIPTTSGSGSEATWATVITDKSARAKLELASKELIPDIVILDPEFPKLMPPGLTAATGLDALTHAVEAYVNQWRNEFSDPMALEAVRTIFRYLPIAYENPDDIEARGRMHVAATMAGLAFSNANAGLAHAMAHALGGVFRVPHGRAVGILLPYVVEYSVWDAVERYSRIAEEIGIEADGGDAVRRLVQALRELLRGLNVPLSLGGLDISREAFMQEIDGLVGKAIVSSLSITNPRVPDDVECKRLFVCAFDGEEVSF